MNFFKNLSRLNISVSRFFISMDEFLQRPSKLDRKVSNGRSLQQFLITNVDWNTMVRVTVNKYVSIGVTFLELKQDVGRNLCELALKIQSYERYLFLYQEYRVKDNISIVYSKRYGSEQTILRRLFYNVMFARLADILYSNNPCALLFIASTNFGLLGVLFGLFPKIGSTYFRDFGRYGKHGWADFFKMINCVEEWKHLQNIFMNLPDLLVMFLSGIDISKIVKKFVISMRKDLGFDKDVEGFKKIKGYENIMKIARDIKRFLKNSVILNEIRVALHLGFITEHKIGGIVLYPTGHSCLLNESNIPEIIYGYILAHQMMLLITFANEIQSLFKGLYCIGLFHESIVLYYDGVDVPLIRRQFFLPPYNTTKYIVHRVFDAQAEKLGISSLTFLDIRWKSLEDT